jgi:cysteine synthase A
VVEKGLEQGKAPVYNSVLDMIGRTPMLRLHRIGKGVKPEILAKLEFRNPSCSVKDRIALYMIEDAERKGLLKPGGTIIEPTTGNTGIALSLVASLKGYKMIVVMPEFVSKERKTICEAHGAEVILTKKEDGILGVLRKAQDLLSKTPNAFMPHQFSNVSNPMAHQTTTGQEILRQTDGELDVFVAAAGTGGTISGVARALREKIPDVRIVVVEPAGSPVLSGGRPGHHKIEGVGEGFVPDVLDTSLFDEIVTVSDEDAMGTARELVRQEGVLAGISSGANIYAALKIAKKMDGGRIVTLMADCGLRYLSTELYCPCSGCPNK